MAYYLLLRRYDVVGTALLISKSYSLANDFEERKASLVHPCGAYGLKTQLLHILILHNLVRQSQSIRESAKGASNQPPPSRVSLERKILLNHSNVQPHTTRPHPIPSVLLHRWDLPSDAILLLDKVRIDRKLDLIAEPSNLGFLDRASALPTPNNAFPNNENSQNTSSEAT